MISYSSTVTSVMTKLFEKNRLNDESYNSSLEKLLMVSKKVISSEE